MLIIPLILTTLVAGVVSLGDPKKLGSIGGKAVALYLVTTFFAVWIGIGFGLAFQPGAGGQSRRRRADPCGHQCAGHNRAPDRHRADQSGRGHGRHRRSGRDLFSRSCWASPSSWRASPASLWAICFSSAADVVLKITHIVMEVAPFGVFALVAHTVATQGIEALASVAVLIVTVYLALIAHAIIVYGGFIRFVLNLPVFSFARGIIDAQAVAFSTASSAGTLPVTIANVTDNLGVKRSVAGSVLPLGATINMDGTGIYLGILALFTAQAFGYDLNFAQYAMIAITAALASIGAAGIPSAGLFLLAIVLGTFDVPPEQIAIIVGFILPVDRIMDMARTTVNVTGDAMVATAVAKWEGELDEDRFRAPADKPYTAPDRAPDVADADRD